MQNQFKYVAIAKQIVEFKKAYRARDRDIWPYKIRATQYRPSFLIHGPSFTYSQLLSKLTWKDGAPTEQQFREFLVSAYDCSYPALRCLENILPNYELKKLLRYVILQEFNDIPQDFFNSLSGFRLVTFNESFDYRRSLNSNYLRTADINCITHYYLSVARKFYAEHTIKTTLAINNALLARFDHHIHSYLLQMPLDIPIIDLDE